jgi:hypothetical protein
VEKVEGIPKREVDGREKRERTWGWRAGWMA